MARDLSVPLRQAVVTRLKAAALAGGQVHGPRGLTDPIWPFIRVGLPSVVPVPSSCGDATSYEFVVHVFAKGDDERAVSGLAAQVSAEMDGFRVQLVDDPEAWLQDMLWTGTQVLTDTAEENGWHGIISLRAEVNG